MATGDLGNWVSKGPNGKPGVWHTSVDQYGNVSNDWFEEMPTPPAGWVEVFRDNKGYYEYGAQAPTPPPTTPPAPTPPSPTPPAPTPPAPTPPAPTPPAPTPPNDSAVWGPYNQYLSRMGLGTGYWNPAQRYQESMFHPMRWLWQSRQPIYADVGQGTAPWTDYINQWGGGMGGILSGARDTMNTLFNTPQDKRSLYYEPTYDPMTGEASWQGGNLSSLQDLLQMGLAQQFGPYGAQHVASRLPQMSAQWGLAQSQGAPQQTFLDYLRGKYGI